MKIYFVSAEVEPFAKSGGMGDVVGALPKSLADKRIHDVRVIMPCYAVIPKQYRDAMKPVATFEVWLGWRKRQCRLLEFRRDWVTYYFVDCPYYYGGASIYDNNDLERFAFFCKVALDALVHVNFRPDIIHCNDWSTALVPVMFNCFYKRTKTYAKTKTVFTIHNLKYQGIYDIGEVVDRTGLPGEYMTVDKLEFYGKCNLMKGAIVYSDAITTVSERYAEEITGSDYGEGLQDVIRQYAHKLTGITNGVDYSIYSPRFDGKLYKTYGIEDYAEGKVENKRMVLFELGIENRDLPLVSMISRLYEQKGPDFVLGVIDDLVKKGVNVVILGSGDRSIELAFLEAAARHPDNVRVIIGFDDRLAHRLYAGADLLMMPSRFEPCGLSQLIAMRYGTIPVVRATGGLADTVKRPKDGDEKAGKGFVFKQPFTFDFRTALFDGIEMLTSRRSDFEKLIEWDMTRDYSWRTGADKYLSLYESLISAE